MYQLLFSLITHLIEQPCELPKHPTYLIHIYRITRLIFKNTSISSLCFNSVSCSAHSPTRSLRNKLNHLQENAPIVARCVGQLWRCFCVGNKSELSLGGKDESHRNKTGRYSGTRGWSSSASEIRYN